MGYLLAAERPSKPTHGPTLISVDNTQITVAIGACTDSNGAPITAYTLHLKNGVTGTK